MAGETEVRALASFSSSSFHSQREWVYNKLSNKSEEEEGGRGGKGADMTGKKRWKEEKGDWKVVARTKISFSNSRNRGPGFFFCRR